ncbi:MAG: amidohydrolase family protein, partial [Gemmatimonadaceae bacterium]
YVALLEAARRRGLRTAGHQPSSDIGLRGALAAGQRSIEHIEGLGELEGMAGSARDSLARGFAAAEIWFTPTLVASFGRFQPESLLTARAAGMTAEPEQSLVTPALRASWTSQLALKKYDSPLDEYRIMVVGGLAGMRRLKAAGVKILAGTDLAVVNQFPGLALHEELAFLVDSLGLSPLQAIQAATVGPARYFGIVDSIGTVEPGKQADLLILTADPLADIRNTRRIETVILRGRVVPAQP